jgi:smad nuclear-interacting protein 1
MAGRSASPPPHRTRDSLQRPETSRGSGRRHGDDRNGRRYHEEDRGYSSRETRYGGDDRWGGGGDRREQYSERDRERERAKDRDRYDGRRDRESDRDRTARSRRSASPPRRSSDPRSPQRRSQSRSVSPASKAKPDFAPSGLLAAETNTVKAVNGDSTVLKYNEPPEARKPILGWRLYVFKGTEQVGEMYSRI